MKYVTTSYQMLNSYGYRTTRVGFSSMASTNVFSPQDSTIIVLQGVTHEQIHRKVTFISSHGEECYLKEKSIDFPSSVHLDSLTGRTKDLIFYQNSLIVDLPKTKSSKNIALNEVVPQHIDIDISLVSTTMSDTRDIF